MCWFDGSARFYLNAHKWLKYRYVFSEWLQLKGSMPQGSWLGPLTFIILINSLTANCLLHKYFDDTTLSEFVRCGELSIMDQHIADVISWSQANSMNINWKKIRNVNDQYTE